MTCIEDTITHLKMFWQTLSLYALCDNSNANPFWHYCPMEYGVNLSIFYSGMWKTYSIKGNYSYKYQVLLSSTISPNLATCFVLQEKKSIMPLCRLCDVLANIKKLLQINACNGLVCILVLTVRIGCIFQS